MLNWDLDGEEVTQVKDTIKIELVPINEMEWAWDITWAHREATVADFLEAFNQFQDEKVAPCGSCTGCCWERAPLTAPDILRFGEVLFNEEELAKPFRTFVERYAIVHAQKGVVDIILRRKEDEACLFLDLNKPGCSLHSHRPLVCQSHVCLPATLRGGRIRSALVNAGENELVRRYALEFGNDPPLIHEGGGPVNWQAYEGKGFKDKTAFNQVLLKEVLEAELWQQISGASSPADNGGSKNCSVPQFDPEQ